MITFGPKTKSKELNIKMMHSTIENNPEIKLLGVTIDDQLTFKTHVSNVCKKASKQVGVISRLRNLIPTKAKVQIYKSAILPHLTYCQSVWHFCRASDSRKVERVQARGLRAVYGSRSDTYEELLRTAKLPSLRNRRLQDMAIIMYKVKNNLHHKPVLTKHRPVQSKRLHETKV